MFSFIQNSPRLRTTPMSFSRCTGQTVAPAYHALLLSSEGEPAANTRDSLDGSSENRAEGKNPIPDSYRLCSPIYRTFMFSLRCDRHVTVHWFQAYSVMIRYLSVLGNGHHSLGDTCHHT